MMTDACSMDGAVHGIPARHQDGGIEPSDADGQIEMRGRPGDAAYTKHQVTTNQPDEEHGFRCYQHQYAESCITDGWLKREGRGATAVSRELRSVFFSFIEQLLSGHHGRHGYPSRLLFQNDETERRHEIHKDEEGKTNTKDSFLFLPEKLACNLHLKRHFVQSHDH